MSTTSESANPRSGDRIPKLRTRGRANRQKLLDVAQQLLSERRGEPLRFREVFETADISRGSAYRIYDGIQDLLQDLATDWLFGFARFLRRNKPPTGLDDWRELSDHILATAAVHWMATVEILVVVPRAPTYATEYYKTGVRDVVTTVAETFDSHFEMSKVPKWLTVLSLYLQIGDTIFADAVRQEGTISDACLAETQRLCATYLSYHLPDTLTPRGEA